MRRIVIVGGSLAGLRAAQTLRREGFTGRLVMVGDERVGPYNRPPLSKAFLAGAVAPETVLFPEVHNLDLELMTGCPAAGLSVEDREVHLADGRTVGFDGLIVATGAEPRQLPSLAADPDRGVHQLRTIDDAVRLRAALAQASRVVIVGGGLVGTEVASTCRDLGLGVTLVSPLPVLDRVLGPLAKAAEDRLRSHGVDVVCRAVAGFTGSPSVRGVRLDEGEELPADVVVVAVGAVPSTRWIGDALPTRDGVLCDERMRVVGHDGIVAAGDVARWPHPALAEGTVRLEHWTNASEQAVAAARTLLSGDAAPPYAPIPYFWTDQFGTRIQGVGLPAPGQDVTVMSGDPSSGNFVAEFRQDGRLMGAVAAGDARALLPYRRELAAAYAALTSPSTG